MPLPCADRGTSYVAVATDLPSGVVEALTSKAERLRPFAGGDFAPSPPPALLDQLTDQLLVVASDAVTAVAARASPPMSGKATLRLLAWVLADARGGGRPMEKALAETVGKRLEKQAQKVRQTLAAATADAAQAREAARAAAAQDADLAATLATELATIDALEKSAYQSARDEVYVGFHELGSSSEVASGPLSVSVEEPLPLPERVGEEPEEGPARDGLLQRALARILTQEHTIDQLRETNEAQERRMRSERAEMYQQRKEDERCQRILDWELFDTENALSDAHMQLGSRSEQVEERVRDIRADLQYDVAMAQMDNVALKRRVRELEAEVERLKNV